MRTPILLVTALGVGLCGTFAKASSPPTDIGTLPAAGTPFLSFNQGPNTPWRATGGQIAFRFNPDMLAELGLSVRGAVRSKRAGEYLEFDLDTRESIQFEVERVALQRLTQGSLIANGGFILGTPNGNVDLRGFSVQVDSKEDFRLLLLDGQGKVWMYADNLMYEGVSNSLNLRIPTMDWRVGPALARSIGLADVAGLAVADGRIETPIVGRSETGPMPNSCSNPNWPIVVGTGQPNPAYRADVLMESMSTQQMRCRLSNQTGQCDGTGDDNGEVILAPNSTLRNSGDNNANGSQGACSADNTCTADVPWYQKFSGQRPPYNNDQHPFLIWNMYRVDAQGRIDQIGRSGVKHAFLTTNTGCADGSCSGVGSVLGLSCGDTYSTGNNDSNSSQGPRSEIVPNKGLWGRCGSIYDLDCNGSANPSGLTVWDQRMPVRESQMQASLNPQAQYYFQSWYIVRDDINIYNTMGTHRVTPSFGSQWSLPTTGPMTAGPALSRWVDPVSPGANARNTELVAPEGHVRVAVKVVDIAGAQRRFNFGVENFDFAREVTQGAEPNLRVVRNLGFSSFSVPVDAPSVTEIWFSDGDLNPANDWTATFANGRVTWTAPAGAELNWGTLYGFSFVATGAVVDSMSTLGVAEPGATPTYDVQTLGVSASTLFSNGFE